MRDEIPFGFKLIAGGVILMIALIILAMVWPFAQIDQTERGIVLRFGEIVRTLEPGLHWRTPFIESVVKMDVTTQKEEVAASAATKDLQSVSSTIAVNYSVSPDKVADVYSQFRRDYSAIVIAPSVQEVVKAATAKFTAEELLTKRPQVKEEMVTALRDRLANSDITVSDVSIVNFDFPPAFNAAIEAKVQAEQEALKAKNDLERIKFEADQKVEQAQAEAESIRLQSDAANNPRYVELKKLEVQLEYAKKWNGTLPVNLYGSAPIPFLDLSK